MEIMIATLKTKLQSKIANDKHFAELVKGSGIAFTLRIVGIIAGYIFTLLVTRTLGAEAWGIFSLSLVVLQIASVIGRLGMDTTLLRFTAEYTAKRQEDTLKEIYRKILILVIPSSILITIFIYLLSPILAGRIFHKPYLYTYFKAMALAIVPFILLWIHTEGLRGMSKIKEYMLLQQVGIFFFSSFLLFFLSYFYRNKLLPILVFNISVYLLALISFLRFTQYILFQTPNATNSENFSYTQLLRYSIPLLLTNMLTFIMSWTDILMIGMFLNEKLVGIYSVSLRISYVISFILFAVNSITVPKIAKAYTQGNIELFKKLSQWTSQMGLLFGLPIFIILISFSSILLKMFGEEFILGQKAFIVLCVGQLINTIVGSVGYILSMSDNQNVMSFIILCSFLINVILNYTLIPTYGICGAAVATMVSTIVWNLLGLGYIRYKFGFWNIKIW